ncbi:M28 family metallopeptidase [Microbacterium azadirachtae]|uniref:Peptidase family M28 n=1 Tax=Microbacterium azadirachtae TaxID=582680 RepID=A0A0F0L1Y4_9MICO|nr:M28 family peptidase [Microbacterium azadirachtae]KJL27152.1 Peptidase family M28 [Microbacterium azadirachtae]UXW85376.1 M28 family metallopeptidase [Microbacterium azadirachtae]
MTTSLRPTVDLDLFPTTERIHGWIDDLAALGHRRTGTPQGRRSAEYIESVLREAGLEEVRIETAPTPCPVVRNQGLTLGGERIDTFWANGTGRTAPLGRFVHSLPDETPIVHVGAGWQADFEGVDVEGKIVVCDIEFLPMNAESMMARNDRMEMLDPDGTLAEPVNKFDIYSPNNWPNNYFFAQQRGAVGFVGSLRDYMDASYYNEDYTENGLALGVDGSRIPALWVSRADGDRIVETIAVPGRAVAALQLDVEYTLEDALNVRGTLPGQSEDIILVHSHHDAVFAGAVQDGSGVSEVLALAEYFAKTPIDQRPKTMMFALTDTHFTDYVGHEAFIAARDEAADRIVLDLCIEHIGKEVELSDDGGAVETGRSEPRIVYVSNESGLLPDVRDAFERNGLGRTFLAPVSASEHANDEVYEFHADEVISDAYSFAEAGIPVVSLVAGQMYLFHPSDTIDRVSVDDLRPVGIAFAEIALAAGEKL